MSIYAIGSVYGNHALLVKALEKLQFQAETDKLWFTGNLVKPGSEALQVLRLVKQLGKAAVTVLGPEELRLLSIAYGFADAQAEQGYAELLNADDKDELLKWLRQRPLIQHDSKANYTLVHAGVLPEWSFSQALTCAYEVESVLSQANFKAFLENRKQDQSRWHAKLKGWKRLNFICNAYTLMTYSSPQGKLDFHAVGKVGDQSAESLPWYRLDERNTKQLNIVFADDGGFADAAVPGIYPLAPLEQLRIYKLAEQAECIVLADDY
jgi:bis(5'-nucleosyl)-tetraphosphatase (symmetrical)